MRTRRSFIAYEASRERTLFERIQDMNTIKEGMVVQVPRQEGFRTGNRGSRHGHGIPEGKLVPPLDINRFQYQGHVRVHHGPPPKYVNATGILFLT